MSPVWTGKRGREHKKPLTKYWWNHLIMPYSSLKNVRKVFPTTCITESVTNRRSWTSLVSREAVYLWCSLPFRNSVPRPCVSFDYDRQRYKWWRLTKIGTFWWVQTRSLRWHIYIKFGQCCCRPLDELSRNWVFKSEKKGTRYLRATIKKSKSKDWPVEIIAVQFWWSEV